jgi:hypothetical protein
MLSHHRGTLSVGVNRAAPLSILAPRMARCVNHAQKHRLSRGSSWQSSRDALQIARAGEASPRDRSFDREEQSMDLQSFLQRVRDRRAGEPSEVWKVHKVPPRICAPTASCMGIRACGMG